jgi:hypothetical protein
LPLSRSNVVDEETHSSPDHRKVDNPALAAGASVSDCKDGSAAQRRKYLPGGLARAAHEYHMTTLRCGCGGNPSDCYRVAVHTLGNCSLVEQAAEWIAAYGAQL